MPNIEPIQAVFRNAGLYAHAADTLLCEQLAVAARLPPGFFALPPGVRLEPQSVVVRFGRREVVVRCNSNGDDHVIELFAVPAGCEGAPIGCVISIPNHQRPLVTMTFPTQGHANRVWSAMHPVDQQVTDAMVERAVDTWEQYWGGFTGRDAAEFRRAAIRHLLEQALEVQK